MVIGVRYERVFWKVVGEGYVLVRVRFNLVNVTYDQQRRRIIFSEVFARCGEH